MDIQNSINSLTWFNLVDKLKKILSNLNKTINLLSNNSSGVKNYKAIVGFDIDTLSGYSYSSNEVILENTLGVDNLFTDGNISEFDLTSISTNLFEDKNKVFISITPLSSDSDIENPSFNQNIQTRFVGNSLIIQGFKSGDYNIEHLGAMYIEIKIYP